MKSSSVRLVALLVASLLLTACTLSAPADDGRKKKKAKDRPSPTLTVGASETTDPPSDGPSSSAADTDGDGVADDVDAYPDDPNHAEALTISVTCDTADGPIEFVIDRVAPDWAQVWATELPLRRVDRSIGILGCEKSGTSTRGRLQPVSDAEQAIWDADQDRSEYTLTIPYEQCVEHDDPWYKNVYPKSLAQAEEVETMLTLCPDHPNAAAIRRRAAEQLESSEPTGTYYASCDDLHADYPSGVANNAAAADATVAEGFSRPASDAQARAVYSSNASHLDLDDDGVACET